MRSASAPDAPLAPLAAGFSTQAFEQRQWRVFSLRSGDVWVQVAERDDVRRELSEKLALAAATPLIVGIPLLLVLLSLLIRYGLAPLSSLAHQIEARQPGSVTRLTLSRTPAEIAPRPRRAERPARAGARRARARAPLHGRRGPRAAHAARGAQGARTERGARSSAAEREASLHRMLIGLERTVHLAEQMLAYSRAAAPGEPVQLGPVSLRRLVAERSRIFSRASASGPSRWT